MLVNAEDLYFSNHTLVDFIDEIHKYSDWSRELKLIYDYHRHLQVIFTGSSILDITQGEADLSRRVVGYELAGLSFREFLLFRHDIEIPSATLDDIINHNVDFPDEFKPYAYFADYLQTGYYPFSHEHNFEYRLAQTVTKTLEVDIPQYTEITTAMAKKLKRLLTIISESVPFKPNMTSIAQILGVSRNILPEWFVFMERAGLIAQLRDDTGGIRGLGKVEKVYLDNPNLMNLLGNADTGNVRETFFFNQMHVSHDVIVSPAADFQIGDLTFEIGGKNKKQKQISGIPNAFVVKDDIEKGYANVLPLWMFGLGY